MKVCLVCEGSYPYVSGGVASWIQMLVQAMPETEFSIWSIATTKKEMSKYKYQLPANITEVQTFYLGERLLGEGKRQKCRLRENEKVTLENLVAGSPDEIQWKACLELIKKHRKSMQSLLMGETFYDIALALYLKHENKSIFNEYLWSLRGMYYPFMSILADEFPEADIYHAVATGYAGIVAGVASFVSDKPLLLSEHGIYTREREEDIIRSNWLKGEFKELWIDFFKKISIIAYKQAALVTSLFETNQTLQVELGCPKEKIEIIPNGIDADAFDGLKPRSAESREYFNIGAILRIVPIKDIKSMLVGYAMARRQIPNARLNILGNFDENPEYYEECMELVREMQIPDVIFHGQVAVKEYLPEFDLLLLTSISEGQPLAVLEGLGAGIPFICTNVGDCRGLLYGKEGDDEGQAGIIVSVMDTEELAKQLVYYSAHKEELAKMGEAGKRRVKKFYRKEDFLQRYAEIYRSLGDVG